LDQRRINTESSHAMPRPKPASPTTIKKISVRWSQEEHIMFLRLGGSKWVRETVQEHYAEYLKQRENSVNRPRVPLERD